MPLSAAELRNLTPRERPFERRDSGVGGVQGLLFHVAPSGRRTWFLVYDRAGRRRKFRLGEYPGLTLAQARDRARELRAAIARGGDPQDEVRKARQARAQAVSVEAVVDRYLRSLERRGKRSRLEDERYLRRALLQQHAASAIADVDRATLTVYLDRYADQAPIGANRCLAALKTFFRWAHAEGYRQDDPTATIRKPTPERARKRILTLDEVATVWMRLDHTDLAPVMRLALRFLLLTGARRNEVLGALWSEIDARAGIWHVPDTRMKSKRDFVVPLSSAARRVLAAARDVSAEVPGFVFASPATGLEMHRDTLSHALARNLAALHVRRFSPHDLRRTLAHHLHALGFSTDVVSATLGHSRHDVTHRHYSHFDFLEERRRALEAWGDVVEGRRAEDDHASVV